MFPLARASSLLGLALLVAPAGAQVVFEPPIASPAGGYATRVLAGDIDEDGLPDALVSHFPFFGADPAFLPGLGDGSFGPPQVVPLPGDLITVVELADFDADGHLDVVAIGGTAFPGNVSIYFGDGRGSFGSPAFVNSTHQAPADAAAADFDADGALDLAIYNSVGFFPIGGGITLRFGHGDGTFEPAVMAETFNFTMAAYPGPHSVRAGDLNGDGLPDLAFSSTDPVLLNQGGRTFEPAPCANDCVALAGPDLALADVNGDGRDDALTPTQVFLSLPSGALAEPLPLASGFVPVRVTAGDLDGDGLIDAVVSRTETALFSPTSSFGDVLVLRGQGDGSFLAPVVVSHVPQGADVTVADVDLDGRPDVLAGSLTEDGQSLRTLLNHTYPAGSPFTDLGGALGGTNGYPIQLASGTLVAGQPFAFKLANGPPNGAAFHIVGVSQLAAPFKGGTLIPFPHLINGPLPLNGSGAINLAALWPAGGSGLTLWVQFWMPNGGGPAGFVASSGVRAQIP